MWTVLQRNGPNHLGFWLNAALLPTPARVHDLVGRMKVGIEKKRPFAAFRGRFAAFRGPFAAFR